MNLSLLESMIMSLNSICLAEVVRTLDFNKSKMRAQHLISLEQTRAKSFLSLCLGLHLINKFASLKNCSLELLHKYASCLNHSTIPQKSESSKCRWKYLRSNWLSEIMFLECWAAAGPMSAVATSTISRLLAESAILSLSWCQLIIHKPSTRL